MNVWLSVSAIPLQHLPDIAICAEEIGIEGLAVSDHACIPGVVSSPYPYTPDRAVSFPRSSEFPEPLTLISALGAVTSRLRFMTYALVLPLRHPVPLASSVATVACLTGGRVDLGVGIGWLQEEFNALGIPFEHRGDRVEESLRVLQRLWSGEMIEHRGRYYSFDALAVRPTPPKPITVLVAGHSPAAIRRAASVGDGWIGVNPDIDEIATVTTKLKAERRTAGRADERFEVRSGVRGPLTAEGIVALADAGVTSLCLMPWQLVERTRHPERFSTSAVVEGLQEATDLVRCALGERVIPRHGSRQAGSV